MKWEGQEQSTNVEDRRGGGGLPIGGRGIGVGTIVIALVAGWIFGINPFTVLGLLGGEGGPAVVQQPQAGARAAARRSGGGIRLHRAARHRDRLGARSSAGRLDVPGARWCCFAATPTACGTGESAMGPFYCPGDRKVYLDLDFFDTRASRLGAPGEFAAGLCRGARGRTPRRTCWASPTRSMPCALARRSRDDALSVRVELQADRLAGVWTHHSQQGGLA